MHRSSVEVKLNIFEQPNFEKSDKIIFKYGARHDLNDHYKKHGSQRNVQSFLLPVILGTPAELDATIVARQMCLSSPVNLPLVAAQLRVVVEVLVTSLAVELRVHRVFLVIVTIVEGDTREVELAVCAVWFLRNHPVYALVVAVERSGVYEELVAERTSTVHVLTMSFV